MRSDVSLRDIYEAVGSLEKKIDGRLEKFDSRLEAVEIFKERAWVIVLFFTISLTTGINYLWKKIVGD